MHLLGWSQPLPEFIVTAVQSGTLTVYTETIKGQTYQFLRGTVQSPYGYLVEFR